ncbi:RepB family plasmid replication initiator protein [Photorhabdus australis]|uniref:RepB family plasmid replication initiator protein n=1 Tax=Photorhabdus australis TaxID=286156 RepID=UPI000907A373
MEITGDRPVSLNDFRTILGIEDKYLQFRDLNKLLLKTNNKELNKKIVILITIFIFNFNASKKQYFRFLFLDLYYHCNFYLCVRLQT